MKRSLTIGCVLLVGGGVSNCGGSVETASGPGEEPSAHAGAGGSGAAWEGLVGDAGAASDPEMGGAAGATASEGGVASWNDDEPPAVGVAPHGGSGGAWVGVPPK
jgi:hypothetical protein